MSVNVKKCHTLSPELSNQLGVEPHPSTLPPQEETLPLPPGFDASLFTPAQTEYISDLFVATVRDYLRRLDAILETTEPGVSPTATRLGINWVLLRKLAGISPRHAAMSWRALRLSASTKPHYFDSQRRAMFAALRQFTSQPLTTRDNGPSRRS